MNNNRFDFLDKINIMAFMAQLIDMIDNNELEDYLKKEIEELHKENKEILNKLNEIKKGREYHWN